MCLGKQTYPIVKVRKYSLVVSVTVESKHSTSSEERSFQRDLRHAHRREEKNIYTIFAKCKVIEKMEKEILVMFKRFVLFFFLSEKRLGDPKSSVMPLLLINVSKKE